MALFGMDISKWNGELNFSAVKRAGIRFAMVKATQGHALSAGHYLFEDSRFAANLRGLAAVGIPAGAYHFFTASNEAEAVREADFFIAACKPYRKLLPLWLACDAENYNNRWLLGLSRERLSALITRFCKRVEEAGFSACHYTNTDHIANFIDLDKIPYPVWQAHYIKNGVAKKPSQAGEKLAIHQYTASGQLIGVPGDFDLNFGYAPLSRKIIRQLTTLEDQTLDYIMKFSTGENLLAKLADKLVARELKPVRDESEARLVSLIRYHCALSEGESTHLAAYKFARELHEKLYRGMLA